MTGAGVFDIVVGKLRYKKKPCPIILLKVDKGSEVEFYCIILLFSLPICREVESSGEFLLGA